MDSIYIIKLSKSLDLAGLSFAFLYFYWIKDYNIARD